MPLNPNATMTFEDYTMYTDDRLPILGIKLHFVCLDPGPALPNDYYIVITEAELGAVNNQAQLRTLVQNKLNAQLRFAGIATKLDPFIGQSLVV